MDCIFCKIIAKQIPNHTVYEDDSVLAFLDIFPCAKGHTVVIPKIHSVTALDTDDSVLQHVMVGVKRAMERIDVALHPDGYNVGWNHGDIGGQAVKHLHVHILPRYTGDGGGNTHSIVKNSGDQSVEEIAKLFT